LIAIFILANITIATSYQIYTEPTSKKYFATLSNDYDIQWEMNFGSDSGYGARFEGPQPIGDCDNDGDIELLIGGRDSSLRIFEWDDAKQTYLEKHTLHPPFYPDVDSDAGGFAIGDLTGDGENEIAATWSATVYKYIRGQYRIIGWNNWIFENGGGNGDCYIGDYDNDGENELIMSGGPIQRDSEVPEIVVFGWNGISLVKEAEWGISLVKEAEWKNPDNLPYKYIYMAGMGDIDYDGKNEIVCGSGFKVWVLDWNEDTNMFEATVIKETIPDYDNEYFPYPFACVCKDSDMDGKVEINVGYMIPEISVFEWNGDFYETKFEIGWENEYSIIEALDVGDVDGDGINELCAGTNLVHILQWNGETYEQEAVLPTWGWLAVLNIGDIDNDGQNELNTGSVGIDPGEDYMSWTYKFGWENNINEPSDEEGAVEVHVKSKIIGTGLGSGSVAAWNLKTHTWYDLQPIWNDWGGYRRYNLPTGEYLLRVTLDSYKSQETQIFIESGEVTSHTFNVEVESLIKNTLNSQILNQLFLLLLNKFNILF
jgi:hypothetical protein